jgi:integrase
MTAIRLKYVNAFRDRHGKLRYFFRRRGHKSVALKGMPGSAEFMAAYDAALSGQTAPRIEVGAARIKPGTIADLATKYFASTSFRNKAIETQRSRRNILERFAIENGEKPVALLERRHVQVMVDAKANTPSASRNFLNVLRALIKFAIKEGIIDKDPTVGVERVRIQTEGWRTWSEEDIGKFEAVHPIGTRERLALALLLYTGQRPSDVVRMGKQHVRKAAIHVRQKKTGTTLEIPTDPRLREVLLAMPSEHMTFLTTASGKPFSEKGFGNWFRKALDKARLPKGTGAHGFRKAAARRLAEAGCTEKEIAAITGHRTLTEIARYTRAAEQARLAASAMTKLRKEGL